MTLQTKSVYIEFNAAQDGFCLAEDVASANPKVVQGGFESKQQAEDWAKANGYVLNKYIDGKLEV